MARRVACSCVVVAKGQPLGPCVLLGEHAVHAYRDPGGRFFVGEGVAAPPPPTATDPRLAFIQGYTGVSAEIAALVLEAAELYRTSMAPVFDSPASSVPEASPASDRNGTPPSV